MNVDEGILTNMDQLPVTQVNYGGSEDRFSWILYKIDYLKCSGKGEGVTYPSELYQNKLETIENNIQQNANEIDELSERAEDAEDEIAILHDQTTKNKNDIVANDNDISALKSRTTILEGKANQHDFYFKYAAEQ